MGLERATVFGHPRVLATDMPRHSRQGVLQSSPSQVAGMQDEHCPATAPSEARAPAVASTLLATSVMIRPLDSFESPCRWCFSPFGLRWQSPINEVAYKPPKFTSRRSGGWVGAKCKVKARAALASREGPLPGSPSAAFSPCLHVMAGTGERSDSLP